ncbi:MAG: hypothetical protein H5U40_14835 [Polyangiaceae bacterium]|nr:hypothetical protein [Polyangiaceae bacterium]
MHAPILPVVGSPRESRGRAHGAPPLDALRLHHGTIWSWNRAVYDPTGDGHLRIELRTLPAGPTVIDMCANTALLVGLTLGLAEHVEALVTALPFECASRNFYRAAKHGLDAELAWPSKRAPSPGTIRADKLVLSLLPVAERGLAKAGVDRDEIERYLSIIRARVERRQTGALWLERALACARSTDREAALREVLGRYLEHSRSGAPVHEWPSF